MSRLSSVDRWLPRVWGLAGVLVTLAILYVAYLHFWPVDPITIYGVHVTGDQVVGQTLTYQVHACKHVDQPSSVFKTMVGVGNTAHNTVSFAETHGAVGPGCHFTTVKVPLPATVTPGTYYLRDDAQYSGYPLHAPVNVYSQSNVFRVVAAK